MENDALDRAFWLIQEYIAAEKLDVSEPGWIPPASSRDDKILLKAEALCRGLISSSANAKFFRRTAQALLQLGTILHLQGRIAEAKSQLEEGVAILGDLPQLAPDLYRDMEFGEFVLGLIEFLNHEYQAAFVRFCTSRDIAEAIRDHGGASRSENAQWIVWARLKEEGLLPPDLKGKNES